MAAGAYHTMMLEELTDDGHDADVLREAAHTRAHATDSTNDQVHLDACLRRLVQLGRDRLVVDAVDLASHRRRPSRLGVTNLVVDECQELEAHGGGRHQQLSEALLAVVARQILEQVHHVRAQLRIACEKAWVGFKQRSAQTCPKGEGCNVAYGRE